MLDDRGRAELSVTLQILFDDEPLTTSTSTATGEYEEGSVNWAETLFFPHKLQRLVRECAAWS